MLRRLFKLLTILSCAICIAATLLWLITFARPIRFERTRASVRWEVVVSRGFIQVDNVPQIVIEDVQSRSLQKRLADEGRALATQMDDTLAGFVSKSPDERDKAKADFSRLQNAMRATLQKLRVAASPTTSPSTAYVQHTGRLSYIIFAAMALPLLRLILKHRRRAMLHRRWVNCLCTECGYDLRAAVKRCPECGTAVPDSPAKSYLKFAAGEEVK